MLGEGKRGQQSQIFPHKSEGVHVHYVVLALVLICRSGVLWIEVSLWCSCKLCDTFSKRDVCVVLLV